MKKVLYKGLKGIRREVESSLEQTGTTIYTLQTKKKSEFYRAVLIVLDAAMAYSERYAGLAREMAAKRNEPETQEGTGTNCSGMSPGADQPGTGLVGGGTIRLDDTLYLSIGELYNINNNIGRIDRIPVSFLQTVCNLRRKSTTAGTGSGASGMLMGLNLMRYAILLSYDIATFQTGARTQSVCNHRRPDERR